MILFFGSAGGLMMMINIIIIRTGDAVWVWPQGAAIRSV